MVDIDTAVERDMRRKAETEPRQEPLPRDGECAVCGRPVPKKVRGVELCNSHTVEDLDAKREAMSARERRAEEQYARQAAMVGER